MTARQVQALLDAKGGARERRAPVYKLVMENKNKIVTVLDEDGNVLAEVAWRPHDPRNADPHGLFICG